jgi:autotransporter translocation and assembly factor TamB
MYSAKKKVSLLGAFFALLLLIVATYFTVTPAGFHSVLKHLSPSAQKMGIFYKPNHASGNLFNFTFDQLQVRSQTATITLKKVHVRWQPFALLKGKLHIYRFSAYGLTIHTHGLPKSTGTPSTTKTKATLPSLVINNLFIAHIRLYAGKHGRIIPLGAFAGRFHFSTYKLNIKSFSQSASNSLSLDAKATLKSPYPFNISARVNTTTNNDRTAFVRLDSHGTLAQFTLRLYAYLAHKNKNLAQINIEAHRKNNIFSTQKLKITLGHGQLSGHIRIATTTLAPWRVSLKGTHLDPHLVAHYSPDDLSLHLEAHGNAYTQQGTLLLRSPQAKLYGAFSGVYATGSHRWNNLLSTLALTLPKSTWQIKPTHFEFSPTVFDLPHTCLASTTGSLCTTVHWVHGKTSHITLTSHHIQLSDFDGTIPGLNLSGAAKIKVDLTHANKAFTGTALLDIKPLQLLPTHLPLNTQTTFFLRIPEITYQATLKQHTLAQTLQVSLWAQDHAEAAINISHLFEDNTQPTLSGNVNATLHHLDAIGYFIPSITHIAGNIKAHIKLHGTLNAPQFTGTFALQDGTATLVAAGANLKNINMHIASDAQGMLHIKGQATSHKGTLNWAGTTHYKNTHWNSNITLKGSNFAFMNLPYLRVSSSLILHYLRNSKQNSLSGNMTLDHVFVNSAELHPGTIDQTDVVYVNENNVIIQKTDVLPFAMKLKVTLGKDVKFTAAHITTNLKGTLAISTKANQTTVASGTLYLVDGQYSSYGKRFNVTQGIVTFNQSPINNPHLDVKAVYQLNPLDTSDAVSNVVVGVRLTGTLHNYKLTLFSTPAMSQDNILSYIVLGQSLNKVQNTQQAALTKAAMMLSINGGSSAVLQSLRHTFGLNEITVGSFENANPESVAQNTAQNSAAQQNNTALFLGKRIGDRLYVSYGVGFFTAEQIFRTRFTLSRHWQLWTDNSNVGSGADIVWQFSR